MPLTLDNSKFLSDQEFEHFQRVLEKYKDTNPRETLIFELLYATAARSNEILSLTSNDLDTSQGVVYLKASKGGHARPIPLKPTLFGRLLAFAKTRPPGERIFNMTYNGLLYHWRIFRPAKKKLHSLRHTRALHVYEEKKDVKLTQLMLGHKNVSTTGVYLDWVYSVQELRKLIF